MYFFTADEHYGHSDIIQYCNRPFKTVEEMDTELIRRHNEAVGPGDTTIHVGDFSLKKNRRLVESAYIKRLNGNHLFVKGSHDYWLDKDPVEIDTGPIQEIWEKDISLGDQNFYIVACHYAMRTWPKIFHGAWQIYGHSHGGLQPIGKQMDVGVDTNNFYPYPLEQIIKHMRKQPAPKSCHHKDRKKIKYGVKK